MKPVPQSIYHHNFSLFDDIKIQIIDKFEFLETGSSKILSTLFDAKVITCFVFQLARGKKTHRVKPSTRPPPRNPDWFSPTCSAVLYRLFLRWPKAFKRFVFLQSPSL
jgi:hypothetical protein